MKTYETWPRRIAADARELARTVRDLLAQVMRKPPSLKDVMGWSGDQREHAAEWASRELLRASDNQTRRIQVPPFINPDHI